MNKYNVILIGEDHHNGLGLVRSLGKHHVKPYGILIGEKETCVVGKSKYWEQIYYVSKYDKVIDLLLSKFKNLNSKAVIIPWTDMAAKIIDENYNLLSVSFVLPSMKHKENELSLYMDKNKQSAFFYENGFNYLATYILDLNQEVVSFAFPVIFKPVMSIEGKKTDIVVCESNDEYLQIKQSLISSGYTRILVQPFLKGKKEYVVIGSITNTMICGNVIQNIRQWPQETGTGSYSFITNEKRINDFSRSLLKKIQEKGFEGLIDIELFEDQNGTYYINEINWRSSGRNFVSLYTKADTVFFYVKNRCGDMTPKEIWNKKTGFTINEIMDAMFFVHKKIPICRWLADFIKAKNYAYFCLSDMKPALFVYKRIIREFKKRKKEEKL